MKKTNFRCGFVVAVFGLLLVLFCSPGLWAGQQPDYFFMENIALSEQSLRKPVAMNSLNSSRTNVEQSLPYMTILVQSEMNWNLPLETETNYETETDELSRLLSEQMNDLRTLRTQWTLLQTLSRELRIDNRELITLLQESEQIIDDLGMRLEAAMERVTDAEDGAIALLYENTELFNKARLAMAHISLLQQQLARAKRGSPISFTLGAVSFGVGTPLIVEGIRAENNTMMWSGVGVIAGTGIVWAVGHYIFGWW